MEIEKLETLSPEHAARLSPLFYTAAEWRAVTNDLATERAELFSLNRGESLAVTFFDTTLNEIVVVAFVGRAVTQFGELIQAVAVNNGATAVRWHTRRPGLARLLKKWNPVDIQTVFRCPVP